MILELYSNMSEPNAITKELTLVKTLSGSLKNSCSILTPVIEVAGLTNDEVTKINYVRIPDFNRYYYVKNIVNIRSGVWEFTLYVDVLMSYSDNIKNLNAVIERQERVYNNYLSDPQFTVYQNPLIRKKKFPKGFTDFSYVLLVAGDSKIERDVTNADGKS